MQHIQNIKEIIDETIASFDGFLVDFHHVGNKLEVLADTVDGISIAECRKINKAIDHYLIENELDWGVEVGSPGLSKPFKVPGQYQKNQGREVSVKLEDGSKTEGTLISVEEDGIVIETKRKERIEGRKKKEVITEQKKYFFEADNDAEKIKETKVVISFK